MKRILALSALLVFFLLAPQAQQKRAATTKGKTTAVQRKTQQSKPVAKKPAAKTAKGKTSAGQKQPATVQSLQSQRQQIQQQIKAQEKRLRTNERDVKKGLENLMMLNNEIAVKRRTIDTIRKSLEEIETEINMLNAQLEQLQRELEDRKQKYVKSMRYMHRNHSVQSQMMFVFSASNFSQMFRRMRFMREYASYQRTQGEDVKVKQAEVSAKQMEMEAVRDHKSTLLARGEQEQRSLEGKQTEQKQAVTSLQKQQRQIQSIIAQQRKKDAALNAQIDRLIAEEVARQKARAAAEAKRKAEEARRRAAELVRKNAAGSEKSKTGEVAETTKKGAARKEAEAAAAEPDYSMNSDDRRISGNFESNRGRLPMPITGPYRVVSHFGQYTVEGLTDVTLDNKGINIKGQPGCQARSIFDGEVSAVFSFGGTMVVMVRHGSYISVYCNLASVGVHRGQKVSTRQVLGRVGQDDILQFQLRRETAKLNPESWLGR